MNYNIIETVEVSNVRFPGFCLISVFLFPAHFNGTEFDKSDKPVSYHSTGNGRVESVNGFFP